jgi:RNA polymerase sigma-70 factor, ECF subfamily
MSTTAKTESRLSEIVAAIQRGSPRAQEELYARISRGLRLMIQRKLQPQDVDDVMHTAFVTSVACIRSGKVRNPEALMGFLRTIVNRQISRRIASYIEDRNQLSLESPESERPYCMETPESEYIENERRNYMLNCLLGLSDRERETLYRFYILEHSKERICDDLNLTETSFRLLKSRARAKFIRRAAAGHVRPLLRVFPLSGRGKAA